MGNVPSLEDEGSRDIEEQVAAEDSLEKDENLLDFTPLFNLDILYKALLTLKEPPGDLLSRNKDALLKWLKTQTERGQTAINEAQFVLFMSPKSSVAEASELFHDLDSEETGFLDATALMLKLKSDPVEPVEALQPCYELPGCLEVYLEDKPKQSESAKKILQFVRQKRLEAEKLGAPVLSQSVSNIKQRHKLVESRYFTLKQREDSYGDSGTGDDGESGGVLFIKKCFSKINVSSSSSKKMENLLDGQTGTYWQSNGSPRTHWIRVFMLPGVLVKELAVTVDSSDDSYMPKNFTLSVGETDNSLKEIKRLAVPRETTGKFVIARNLVSEHRVVQINIKGCHSDGCDVRIRGLHVQGYKHTKESHVSVMDSMVSWYMGVVAATAKASMPVAPSLRGILITQSKMALSNLPPLCLSPFSPSKPEFLSSFVMKEMDKFVTSICELDRVIDRDGLEVLVCFALAHGNTNKIIELLSILLRNSSMKLGLSTVLKRTNDMVKAKKLKHAERLKIQLSSCDGGTKSDEHKAENIFTNTGTPSLQPYMSAENNLVVAVSCQEESKHLMTITRLKVDVKLSESGARAGLVFLSSEDLASTKHKEEMDKFNSWTREDYDSMDRKEGDDRNPVAFFNVDKDNRFVEVEPDVTASGKYLTIKFLGPLNEEAKHITVNYVHLFGHHHTEKSFKSHEALLELETIMVSREEESELEGGVVMLHVMYLLVVLLRDLRGLQTRLTLAHLDPTFLTEPHLEVEKLSLDKVWNLYLALCKPELEDPAVREHGSFLALNLLRSCLPFIKQAPKKDDSEAPAPATSSDNAASLAGQASQPDDEKSSSLADPARLPEEVLLHLCNLLDTDSTEPKVKLLVQEIVTEGVVVFFPDSKARMEYLFSMIGSVMEENQPRSWWIKFEALCQYFSKINSKSVLNLPSEPDQVTEEKTAPTLKMLTSMVVVANREALATLESGVPKPDNLVHLMSAFQAGIFFWCKDILSSDGVKAETKKCVTELLNRYVEMVVCHTRDILSKINDTNRHESANLLQKTIVGRVFPEMVVFLGTMVDLQLDFLDVLKYLTSVLRDLAALHLNQPPISEGNKKNHDEAVESVVGIWVRESPHNYSNNSRVNEDFVCPNAVRFTLDFDSHCHTERRYDYLQFVDENGDKKTFDGVLGDGRWPAKAEFKGSKLHFTFYSDGSNNEWGYKFTLKAYGLPFTPLPWLSDLYMSIAHLMGRLCGYILTAKTRPPSIKGETKEEVAEEETKRKAEDFLLNSEIWRTLFRGGCMVKKLTHSLSGTYSAMPADSRASGILHGLAEGPEGVGKELVEHCQEMMKGQYYGGPLVDCAVNAVFAALVWNSQDCREELESLVVLKDEEISLKPLDLALSSALMSAFKYAESMRRELVEMRQKVMEAKDKIEDEEKKAAMNEDAPVLACKEKALYLLKFPGVSRNPLKGDGEGKWKQCWLAKNKNWSKLSMAVSTVGKLKHLQETTERKRIQDKYPSFELVLSFVRNEALSAEQVGKLLEERAQNARRISQAYRYCADAISVLMDINLYDLPGQLFMQQLLVRQRHIPKHYAAKLDGCGLELENQVRKAYRMLVSRLVNSLGSSPKGLTELENSSRLTMLVYLVHLLDFEWQEYDHTLLNELQLPEFFYTSSVSSSGVKEIVRDAKFEDEDEMLRKYGVHMKLMKELDELLAKGNSWKDLLDNAQEGQELKDVEQFLIGVTQKYSCIKVKCDGCQEVVTGTWYRDIDITEDLDFCPACFAKAQTCASSGYNKDHRFLLLGRFICDGCKMFIITHRFHSNTRSKFNLCLGCFRLEEAATNNGDDWTVYKLTEKKAAENSNRFLSMHPEHSQECSYKDGLLIVMGSSREVGVYAQQHCWLLFNVLTLSMAQVVNSSTNMASEVSPAASNIQLMCLRLLAFTLRAALLAKFDEVDKVTRKMSSNDDKAPSDKPTTESDKPPKEDGDTSPEESKEGKGETEKAEGGEKQAEEAKDTTLVETSSIDNKPAEDTDGDKKRSETSEESPEGRSNQTEVADTSKEEEKKDTDEKEEKKDTGEEEEKKDNGEEEEKKDTGEEEEKKDTGEEEEEEKNLVRLASRNPLEMDARIGELEKTHGVLFLEKALGLLAAILPQDINRSLWIQHKPDIEQYLVHELLPIVLQLACCLKMKESLKLQALLVTAQYLSHLTPEGADITIDVAQGIRNTDEDTPTESGRTFGSKTAQFFFNMGANFLIKSQFSGAATCAECLLQLSKSLPWKSVVTLTLGQCLQTRPQDMDSTSIFGLLVISGFPRIPREGCVVCTSISDKPSCVVLTKVEGNSASGIDTSTRKPVQVKLSEYELKDTSNGCIDETKLDTLLGLLKASFQLCKQESDGQVEHVWILALLLKALQFLIQNSSSSDVITSIFKADLIPTLVKLASRPTLVSKQWYLTDLEVLGISSYLPSKSKVKEEKKEDEGKLEAEGNKVEAVVEPSMADDDRTVGTVAEVSPEDLEERNGEGEAGVVKDKEEGEKKDAKENKVDVTIQFAESAEGDSEEEVKEKKTAEDTKKEEDSRKEKEVARILDGLEDEHKTMLKTMAEVFLCDLTVVRAMFEEAEGDISKFLSNSESFFEQGEFNPSAEILEAAEKWKASTSLSDPVQSKSVGVEDRGVTRVTPMDMDLSTIEAVEEDSSIFKKTKNLLKEADKSQRSGVSSIPVTSSPSPTMNRQDSYKLLWEELSKESLTSRESLCRTIQGVAVLRARQVLACVLRMWPNGGTKLGTTTLGCADIIHYFCLLDLLMHQQTKKEKEMILMSVFGCGEMTETLSLAETAAQCMNTVCVGKERREFAHRGKDKSFRESGKIVISEASGLEIKYYPVNGTVKFSSSESMDDNVKKVTGSVTKTDGVARHKISGDTVYYEVELAGASEAKYPKYSFTVMGTQEGRFDTGFAILDVLVNKDVVELLPVQQMWPLLVGVACQHVGRPRLQVLELLLHIVQLYGKDGPLKDRGRVELSALKPLWQLFTNTMRTYDGKCSNQLILSPDLLRLLTELFLSVENLSQEWGQSEELMMGTLSSQELHRWLERGVSNVAYVSLALGLDNLVSRTFVEERKKKSDLAKTGDSDKSDDEQDGHRNDHLLSDDEDEDSDDEDDDSDNMFDDDDDDDEYSDEG